ncbi:MAG TPA: glycogen/starch/alpha-glucan phosphorylase [Candidatus Saccharimonadales bacterium]|nr:glycogen/starch/alpha-glucan phosphorylase [Candidatus Saccharimonadales bacterium]
MSTEINPWGPEELRQSILRHVRYGMARAVDTLTPADLLKPLSLAVRDCLVDHALATERRYRERDAKRLYYLSMEFLMGRWLSDNLCNLRLEEPCRAILREEYDISLDDVLETEPDAGLGNGGLGRLAACFLESLATMGMPGFGYGIDYEYGLFRQEISGGYQREKPDRWKAEGTPFYLERPHELCSIPLYGRVEHVQDSLGGTHPRWVDCKIVIGVPSDMPVAGYRGAAVNYLRLFSARASEDFDIEIFNRGDYIRAVEQKIASENISRVLYPSDSVMSGRELRLIQEYFLVACSLRDILRSFLASHHTLDELPAKVAMQMNDTHPSLCVAELMRLLLDEHRLEWDRAWAITQATLGYTNHTLLPEALEKWPVSLMERVLPRHMEIIFDINQRLLRTVEGHWPGDMEKQQRMSIIEEGPEKHVRMAHLAIVGSHAVNGVSQLHTQLLKSALAPDFAGLWPGRFSNKTNGVAPRRWILKANPALAGLLTRAVGEEWTTDLGRTAGIERLAHDPAFQQEFLAIKRQNKQKLVKVVLQSTGIGIDPDSLFDVQVKRIHEYKRQLLNVMRVIHEYLCVVEDQAELRVPRTYIFAGKAAPGYWAAKQIIKLVHNVAAVVNADPRVQHRMKVVFVPDYRVSLAETIIPAADLSQQISTAGMEASGTGNMKLAMNGALTLGTLDGANIEIMDAVGKSNFYAFGLTREEVRWYQEQRTYSPRSLYESDPLLRRVLDSLSSDRFSADEHTLFRWIVDEVLDRGDRYFLMADLPGYIEASRQAERDYEMPEVWAGKAILNVARVGYFSSDRTVKEYADETWGIKSATDHETDHPITRSPDHPILDPGHPVLD